MRIRQNHPGERRRRSGSVACDWPEGRPAAGRDRGGRTFPAVTGETISLRTAALAADDLMSAWPGLSSPADRVEVGDEAMLVHPPPARGSRCPTAAYWRLSPTVRPFRLARCGIGHSH